MVLEVGRVCLKIAGRETGRPCVVVKKMADAKGKPNSFVIVTGPKLLTDVKRRKVNINHIEATKYKVEIKEDAPDEEVITALDKAGLVKKFDLKRPSAAKLKPKKEAKEEK